MTSVRNADFLSFVTGNKHVHRYHLVISSYMKIHGGNSE